MGVFESFVDEGLALQGKVALGKLPGGNHDLPITITDLIAVDVDIDKLVVQADLLKLLVHGIERAPVPQTHLGEQVRIVCQRGSGEFSIRRELALLDLIEFEGFPGEVDVARNVGYFEGDLIGFDYQPLDQLWRHAHQQQPDCTDRDPRREYGHEGRWAMGLPALGEARHEGAETGEQWQRSGDD